jgi:hypothetical protein
VLISQPAGMKLNYMVAVSLKLLRFRLRGWGARRFSQPLRFLQTFIVGSCQCKGQTAGLARQKLLHIKLRVGRTICASLTDTYLLSRLTLLFYFRHRAALGDVCVAALKPSC